MTSYVRDTQETATLPAVVPPSIPFEGGRGDFDQGDIEIPRLEIVQGVGDLSADRRFHRGDLVLMREFSIPQPVKLTVFSYEKSFVQNIKFEDGIFPKEFATKEEVFAAGGNLDKGKKAGDDPNNFVMSARLRVAIELPNELVEVPGTLEFEDKFIARAMWKVRGMAYTSIIRRLNLVDAPLQLKGKCVSSKWGLLTVETKHAGIFKVEVPSIEFQGDNSDEYLTFLRKVF